jgi:uncharacterized membrane protein
MSASVVSQNRRSLPLPRSMGWLPFSTLVLCVLGLIDSGYQTYTHFTATGLLGCSAKADACVVVQSSPYAYVLGIPVAVLGLVFYACMLVLCSPQAWRSRQPAIAWLRLVSAVVGVVFVLYLVYCEVIRLGRICPYCTSVHVITLMLFGLVIFRAATPGQLPPLTPKGAPGPA